MIETIVCAVVFGLVVSYLGNKYRWLKNAGDRNPECTGG